MYTDSVCVCAYVCVLCVRHKPDAGKKRLVGARLLNPTQTQT